MPPTIEVTLKDISQSLSACLEKLKAEYEQDVAKQIALHKKSALQYAKYKVGDQLEIGNWEDPTIMKVTDVFCIYHNSRLEIGYATDNEDVEIILEKKL